MSLCICVWVYMCWSEYSLIFFYTKWVLGIEHRLSGSVCVYKCICIFTQRPGALPNRQRLLQFFLFKFKIFFYILSSLCSSDWPWNLLRRLGGLELTDQPFMPPEYWP